MKNWKKYLALLTALLLVLSFAACTTPADEEPTDPPVEQTEEPTNEMPTEAPTEEITEVPTKAEVDYSAFKGEWYSGNVTLYVKEETKWTMAEDGDTFITGTLTVDDEGALVLYDVEGVEAAKMILEADGSIYAELYIEELYNCIDDFIFTREKPDYVGMDEIIDDGISEEIVEEPVVEDMEEPAE